VNSSVRVQVVAARAVSPHARAEQRCRCLSRRAAAMFGLGGKFKNGFVQKKICSN